MPSSPGVKILLAAHQFFPESRAGTEILTLGLARALRARGHAVWVLAAKRSRPFSELRPGEVEDYLVDGIPVRRVGRPHESLSRPYILNYRNPQMAALVRDYAMEIRPEVVHFMHLQGLSATAVHAVREVFPVIYTATDFWAICPVVDLRRHDGKMCLGPDMGHCPRCLASRQPDYVPTRLLARVPAGVFRLASGLTHLPAGAAPMPLRQLRYLRWRQAYIREAVNSSDLVLAPSRLMKELLVRNGINPRLVRVTAYGIDTSRIPRSASERKEKGPLRVSFIGTLAPHKGCDLLIRAFRRLPRHASAVLAIHGPSTGFESFGERLARLAGGDRRIVFHGAFPPERVGDVLSRTDVLVVPSRWYENTPVVIYQAFAAGVPVVATNLGGMSEVVEHGRNGLLFQLDDVAGLERQLRRLVEEPGLLERLRSGIGPVKTVEQSAKEMELVYSEIVARRSDG